MIAGYFTAMDGIRTGIARIEFRRQPGYQLQCPGHWAGVSHSLLLNPGSANSKILIVGDFTIPSASGPYYGLARLNCDGSVDASFAHTFTLQRWRANYGEGNRTATSWFVAIP